MDGRNRTTTVILVAAGVLALAMSLRSGPARAEEKAPPAAAQPAPGRHAVALAVDSGWLYRMWSDGTVECRAARPFEGGGWNDINTMR